MLKRLYHFDALILVAFFALFPFLYLLPFELSEKVNTKNNSSLYKLMGSASIISNNEFRLTSNLKSQKGGFYYYPKISFEENFSFSFEAFLGNKDESGADGIILIFHNDPRGTNTPLGSNGGLLAADRIENGIALELDTFFNENFGDISSDHGCIWNTIKEASKRNITKPKRLTNLEDGQYHKVKVYWKKDEKVFYYTVDDVLAGKIKGKDIVKEYFGGSSEVYLAFGASTGYFSNDQRIRLNFL